MAREQLQAVRYYESRVVASADDREWVVQDIADAIVDAWLTAYRRVIAAIGIEVAKGVIACPREYAEAVIEALADELPEVSVERMEAYAAELARAFQAGGEAALNARSACGAV